MNVDYVYPTILCREPEGERAIDRYNFYMLKFLKRFKNEHEDEGNYKVNLNMAEYESR